MNKWVIIIFLLFPVSAAWAVIPPLPVDILGPSEKKIGIALIYSNFIEILDTNKNKLGAIGVVKIEGQVQLFLIKSDSKRRLVGYAENNRLFDDKGKLLGFYKWTPIWSYIYDKSMNKKGKAQCLAYQGVCAAGVAGFLLGLF